MKPETLNELALFAGAGGGILGGKLLGWRTVCAVEWDAYARDVLVARQNDGCLEAFPIWDDIQTFDGRPWRGRIDVVSGGFPCQDISAAGKGAGIEGERSGMWKHMARIIGEVLPDQVWVENSPMLVGRGLTVVLADLAEMGYDAEWGIVGAHHAAAPHKRDRIWLVAKPRSARTGRNDRPTGNPQLGASGQHVPPLRQTHGENGSNRTDPASASGGEMGHANDNGQSPAEKRGGTPQGSHASPPRKIEAGQSARSSEQLPELADTEGKRCGETGELRCEQSTQRACGCCEDVANPDKMRRNGRCREIGEEKGWGQSADSRENMADTGSERGQLPPERELAAIEQPWSNSDARSSGGIAGEWWATEPDVGGMVDGLAFILDIP